MAKEVFELMRFHQVYAERASQLLRQADLIQKAIDRGTTWAVNDFSFKPKNGWAYVLRRVFLNEHGEVIERHAPVISIWKKDHWEDLVGHLPMEKTIDPNRWPDLEVWVKRKANHH
jgi:hypothetical protein